jgi:hypothetical protein
LGRRVFSRGGESVSVGWARGVFVGAKQCRGVWGGAGREALGVRGPVARGGWERRGHATPPGQNPPRAAPRHS